MKMPAARGLIIVLISVAGMATPAVAQPSAGFGTLNAKAIGDSLRVVDALIAHLTTNPRDHAAQHRLGMVAYALEQRGRLRDTPVSIDVRKMRGIAEKAFYAAFDLLPTNTDYSLALGRFTVTGGAVEMLPGDHFRRAIRLAKTATDTAAIIEGARLLGQLYWRHSEWADDRSANNPSMGFTNPTVNPFEVTPVERPRTATSDTDDRGATTGRMNRGEAPNGRLPAIDHHEQLGHLYDLTPPSVTAAAGRDSLLPLRQVMARATTRLREILMPVPRAQYFYLSGEKYTREAYDLDPGNPLVFRQLAAIMLGRERWKELTELAVEQTKRQRDDPMGWMSLGLGLHYQKRTVEARVAFDTAFARMSRAERARLDRIERVLGRADSLRYTALDSAGKVAFERSWWLLSAPLWSRRDVDPRTEFHARLAYAELRWTFDVYAFSGADGANGRHFVRYGLPSQQLGNFTMHSNGLVFSQCMRLLNCVNSDRLLSEEIRTRFPSTWDDIADLSIVEMPASVSRFRASGDSVDVFAVALAPVDTLRTLAVAGQQPMTRMWLYAWDSPAVIERALTVDASGYTSWRERVQPGSYFARFESTIDGSSGAGRAMATVNLGPDSAGFATRGFGLSDVVVARSVAQSGRAQSWRDYTIAPLLNGVPARSDVALLWETYEPGEQNGAASYRVTIDISRERSALGRIAARIVRGFDGRVNQRSSGNALSLEFERKTPHANTLVDNIVLSLGATPPGSYTLRVTVADAVSGRVSARSASLVIVR